MDRSMLERVDRWPEAHRQDLGVDLLGLTHPQHFLAG